MFRAPKKNPNVLIAFEGYNNVGKSTQAKILADKIDAVLTSQPYTWLGKMLDHDLLGVGDGLIAISSTVSTGVEILLHAVDKMIHTQDFVLPTLRKNHVVSDRFTASMYAYQGAMSLATPNQLSGVAEFACPIKPTLYVLIDMERPHGYEDRDLPKWALTVMERYRTLAKRDFDRWAVVDGNGTVEEVAERVDDAVFGRLRV